MPEQIYKHFLLLHAACRVLCSKETALLNCDHAKIWLKTFVKLLATLYGKSNLIGNMHYLIHLTDDVHYMKRPLSSITAFPFEKALGKIKKFLRSGREPLAQICRRLHELFFTKSKRPTKLPSIKILKSLCADASGKIIIKRVFYKGVILTSKSPNNTILLDNGTLLMINEMYLSSNETLDNIKIRGIKLVKKQSLFTYPCDSADLKMWRVNKNYRNVVVCDLNSVFQKMIALNLSYEKKERIYTMPLLHM